MVDGHNLSLEKGTGVATYARNLTYCLRDMGCKVDILYGTRAAPGASDLMREIAFFDSNAGDAPRWLKILRASLETLYAPLGYRASRVPIGTVIRDEFRSRLPHFDRLFNAPDLFRKGQNAFGFFKRFHKVHVDSPDLMHWTYPLPLRIGGAPNVYTLHDLVPLRLPYTTLDNKRRYFRLVKKIARSADHIIRCRRRPKKTSSVSSRCPRSE